MNVITFVIVLCYFKTPHYRINHCNNILVQNKNTLLFYSLSCHLCVSSFGSFPGFTFSCMIPDFYANIPVLYAKIPCYVFSTCSTACGAQVGVGWGGVPWVAWRHPWPIRVFNQAGGLTCQPNSQFPIPVRIPFPQGTGEASYADHTLI